MALEWHGDEAEIHVRGKLFQVLSRAAMAVERRAKLLLSVAGTGVMRAGKVVRKVKGGKGGKTVYGAFPSEPGEPPHKQTGELRKFVTHDVVEAEMTAYVGIQGDVRPEGEEHEGGATQAEIGLYLELGTKRGLAPRPWLRRALAETAAELDEILGGAGGT